MKTQELEICEGIASVWHYHLRIKGKQETLCGNRNVMPTLRPLTWWGLQEEHIPETYCTECENERLKSTST